MDRQFSFDNEKAREAALRHDEILDQLRPRHIEFVKACLAEQAVLRLTLLPLLEAIREELEMPIDIAKYAKAMPQGPVFTDHQLHKLFHAADEPGVDSQSVAMKPSKEGR